MTQLSHYIRTTFTIVLIALVASIFTTSSASGLHKDRTWAKTVKVEKTVLVYSTNFGTATLPNDYGFSHWAIVPQPTVIPEQKPNYPMPVNAPKYDNRLKSFAQEQLDRLLPQKIMRS